MDTYVDEAAIRKLANTIVQTIKTEAHLGDFAKLPPQLRKQHFANDLLKSGLELLAR